MSIIYKGSTAELIIAPGESYNVSNFGLITLSRDYVCASSYAATADGTLSIGSGASGYSGVTLFTKTKKVDGPITTFSCLYTGNSGESIITKSQNMRGFSVPGGYSGRYISPTRTVQIARPKATTGSDSPDVFGSIIVTSVTFGGYTYTGSPVDLGTPFTELSSYSEQYYGNTTVATWTHSIVTSYG